MVLSNNTLALSVHELWQYSTCRTTYYGVLSRLRLTQIMLRNNLKYYRELEHDGDVAEGPLQLCDKQDGGCEAAVHAMYVVTG